MQVGGECYQVFKKCMMRCRMTCLYGEDLVCILGDVVHVFRPPPFFLLLFCFVGVENFKVLCMFRAYVLNRCWMRWRMTCLQGATSLTTMAVNFSLNGGLTSSLSCALTTPFSMTDCKTGD